MLYTRREFNRWFTQSVLGFGMPFWMKYPNEPASIPTNLNPKDLIQAEFWTDLKSNPKATLVHLPVIPESLYPHSNQEPVVFTVQFDAMFNPNAPQKLNLDGALHGDLWGYGRGVIEACERGQAVYLVVELPEFRNRHISFSDWEQYLSAIVQRYPATHVVIGNELNIAPLYYQVTPQLYAQYFVRAVNVLRHYRPQAQVLVYAEAYVPRTEKNGSGGIINLEYGQRLRQILDSLATAQALEQVQGIPMHFYGLSSRLPVALAVYEQICQEYQLPAKIYLRELGKPELAHFSTNEHILCLVQNLAMSLALAGEQRLELVAWHTAFDPHDLRQHSLSQYIEKRLQLRPAFWAFWAIAKLLYQDVRWRKNNGRIWIQGKTSTGVTTTMTWQIHEEYWTVWDAPQIGVERGVKISHGD